MSPDREVLALSWAVGDDDGDGTPKEGILPRLVHAVVMVTMTNARNAGTPSATASLRLAPWQ